LYSAVVGSDAHDTFFVADCGSGLTKPSVPVGGVVLLGLLLLLGVKLLPYSEPADEKRDSFGGSIDSGDVNSSSAASVLLLVLAAAALVAASRRTTLAMLSSSSSSPLVCVLLAVCAFG
jgi:hypothetical protein